MSSTDSHTMATNTNTPETTNGVKLTRNRDKNPYCVSNVGQRIWNPLTQHYIGWQQMYKLRRDDTLDLALLSANAWIDSPEFIGTMTDEEFIKLHSITDTKDTGDLFIENEVSLDKESESITVKLTDGVADQGVVALVRILAQKDEYIARLEERLEQAQEIAGKGEQALLASYNKLSVALKELVRDEEVTFQMESFSLTGYSTEGELLYSCDSSESPDSNEEAGLAAGFFTEYDEPEGQFDFNAEKYSAHQIEMANYLEDLTGVSFWGTKAKFAEYDYHLCLENNPAKFRGTATVIPGIPISWITVDAIAELKYRTCASTAWTTTILDADKLKAMKTHTRDMDTPSYVIWKFTDCYMYYKVDVNDHFKTVLGRNFSTSEELPQEYKPQHLIPISKLKLISKDMFRKDQNEL